jgi:hypothetical protein
MKQLIVDGEEPVLLRMRSQDEIMTTRLRRWLRGCRA